MSHDPGESEFRTECGMEVEAVYEARGEAPDDLGKPGSFPFTRGIYADMYRGRLWTMRQYAGFGTAEETNARYRYLLAQGSTGLSVAFDLPTQMGYDSDHAMAEGEVGRVGVAIDSIEDMRVLFDGIDLDRVSTSMTINATAAVLLALYIAVADERGIARTALRGTVQNDILKEYIARGTYIYPAEPSLRMTSDLVAFCARDVPRWNSISISGYHIREAGSTAPQEIAFTIANGITYVERVLARGVPLEDFAPRLSFFFNAHNDILEEVAKFRAARRLWATVMKERYGASDRSCMLRFHAQTGGSTLTAQQPLNNVVRVAIQTLAAVLGGTQSLHANGYDEALAIPSEESARIALRTQQIVAHESGVTKTVDPLAGSYYVEALTDEIERVAREYLAQIDALGGAAEAAWAKATDEVDGRNERRNWDQRHALQAGVAWQRGLWEVGVAVSIHSGWPTTGMEFEMVPAENEEDGEETGDGEDEGDDACHLVCRSAGSPGWLPRDRRKLPNPIVAARQNLAPSKAMKPCCRRRPRPFKQ